MNSEQLGVLISRCFAIFFAYNLSMFVPSIFVYGRMGDLHSVLFQSSQSVIPLILIVLFWFGAPTIGALITKGIPKQKVTVKIKAEDIQSIALATLGIVFIFRAISPAVRLILNITLGSTFSGWHNINMEREMFTHALNASSYFVLGLFLVFSAKSLSRIIFKLRQFDGTNTKIEKESK